MKIRFQADADLNHVIVLATVRREPTIEFQSSIAGGLAGLSDAEVLTAAAREGRVLVTHDHRTMPSHFFKFLAQENSPGLLVIPQHLSVADAVEDLVLIWSATDSAEWVNRIVYLPL